jgi:hypothetical protein
MLTWLVDSTTVLCVILGGLALILVVTWWQTRKRYFAISAVVPIVLIGGLFLLGRFTETDSQKIENSVHEMVAGLEAHNVDRIFAQVSETFDYHLIKRPEFRQKVAAVMRERNVTGAQVWDLKLKEVSAEKRTGQIEFRVKPKGNWDDQGMSYRCLADFVLDPDGSWRLRSFKIFHAVGAQELSVPGF